VRLRVATYNIHKGVGTDGRRDPARIMAVLHELDADVVALQEADRRFGTREAVLPRALIDEHHWHAVPVAERGASIGWHGNAMLVRRELEIVACARVALTALEPRGAIWAQLRKDGQDFVAAGMHLDLSGLTRRRQITEICHAVAAVEAPRVLMGDLNEWSREKGAFRSFADGYQVLAPGRSFPSRRPVAMLDRIVHSPEMHCAGTGVHHSALAARASDHLPAWADFEL
jgi:endonuclease/exonuclease/phosphatase family metal-dependent hydrolase